MDLVGLKRTAVYDRVKRGIFPAPIDLGGRLIAWRSEDIDAWIDSLTKTGQ